jgi:hypothetical protein
VNRAELVAALRARFAEMRKDFPELVEKIRVASDDVFLAAHTRCAGCGGSHLTVQEFVDRAVPYDDVGAYMVALQELVIARVPDRCLRETERLHSHILRSRN